jgi:hypothetical protein
MCWGDSAYGQSGHDSTVTVGDNVCNLNTLSFISFVDTVPAVQISGSSHICGLFANFRVRCWGYNAYHQLGDTTFNNRGSAPGVQSITKASYVEFGPTINSIPIDAVDAGGIHCAEIERSSIFHSLHSFSIRYHD